MRLTSRTAVLAFAGTLGATAPAGASGDNPNPPPPVQLRTAHIVEWDLPAAMDASPGAMLVDSHGRDKDRLFFVTRLGIPRVFRMNPWKTPMKGSAQWTSWELAEDSFTTGGVRRLKASHDRRYLVVRTATSIQRVDIENCSGGTCPRADVPDQFGNFNVSDLGIDDQNNVFTAALEDMLDPASGNYIQKLPPVATPANAETAPVTVTRWAVGGGAGFCEDLGRTTTTSFPCLSGVFVHPNNRNLVYYSEPQGNNIGELNLTTDTVRRWSLSGLTPADPQAGNVQQPRQLIMDKKNILWVITGTGHLVSLEPATNRIRVHTIPAGLAADPFGIAPDDNVIGYTDAARNMVGMLYPLGPVFTVPPVSGPAPRTTVAKTVVGARATMVSGAVPPVGKVVEALIHTKTDGVFVEAQLDSNGNDDLSPLGITANKGKGQGTFFYAVGFNSTSANRIGFIRLPKNHVMKMKNPRDDDDPEDGWDHPQHPAGWHISDDDDDDSDGLSNGHDSVSREDVVVADDAPLQAGQTASYPMTASSSTLALLAVATADDPLAQLRVDILNPAGLVVATSPATPGVGVASLLLPAPGDYTVKVQNMGVTANTHSPMLINREPWQ